MEILCPHCREPLVRQNQSWVCAHHHCFDQAKEGYLNLSVGSSQKKHGDSKVMVEARSRFLQTGAYSFLQDELHRWTVSLNPTNLLDLGCGEGTYTQVLMAQHKIGIDLSKDALKKAAKKDSSTQYLIASIFDLPLADASVDVCTVCFAPWPLQEIERVLKPSGHVLLVEGAQDHLIELKSFLYKQPILNEEKKPDWSLRSVETKTLTQKVTLSQEALQDLFLMTPYSQRTPQEAKDRLASLTSLTCTFSFYLQTFCKD